MITEQDYSAAEEQYISLTDDELGQLARKAAEAQPALFAYIANYYDSLVEDDSKDFYIQLVYSTWIAYNNKYILKSILDIEEIEKMDEMEGKRLNDLYENEEAILHEVLRRMTEHPQVQLLGSVYTRIGDFYGEEQLADENAENPSYQDAGIISGVINSFINLLEKIRQVIYLS
ncbi:MAG: hypothetical protein Q8941_16895 [Bacteroidota bacterium]|nr:hypothetical protein [Bacteroidota bacterium]